MELAPSVTQVFTLTKTPNVRLCLNSVSKPIQMANVPNVKVVTTLIKTTDAFRTTVHKSTTQENALNVWPAFTLTQIPTVSISQPIVSKRTPMELAPSVTQVFT
jgi:hypothetical protein